MVLIVAVTVLNILLVASLPYWSQQIRREKEEELIFRGIQYAEAIRRFRQRHNRLPNTLQELIEVEPRSIRKLYKDPMTKNGEWGLLFESGPQGQNPQNPQNPNQNQNPNARDDGSGTVDLGSSGTDENGRPTTVGPIKGVRSLSEEESVQVWNEKERYDEWLFTYDLVMVGGGGNPQNPQNPQQPRTGLEATGSPLGVSLKNLGRPFRQGVDPAATASGLQQGTGPDGRPVEIPQGTRVQGKNGGPPTVGDFRNKPRQSGGGGERQ